MSQRALHAGVGCTATRASGRRQQVLTAVSWYSEYSCGQKHLGPRQWDTAQRTDSHFGTARHSLYELTVTVWALRGFNGYRALPRGRSSCPSATRCTRGSPCSAVCRSPRRLSSVAIQSKEPVSSYTKAKRPLQPNLCHAPPRRRADTRALKSTRAGTRAYAHGQRRKPVALRTQADRRRQTRPQCVRHSGTLVPFGGGCTAVRAHP